MTWPEKVIRGYREFTSLPLAACTMTEPVEVRRTNTVQRIA